MAMPSVNVLVPDKMQFSTGVVSGGEIQHPRQWFPDERDGLILWLRAEFAAANAMIDSLCNHLRAVSDPGEYDAVIGSIQQRRCSWNSILHMQQYFSIAEVLYALQQVAWKRKMRRMDKVKVQGKEFKRFGNGGVHGAWSRQGQRFEGTKGNRGSGSDGQFHDPIAPLTGDTVKKGPESERGDEIKLGNEAWKVDKVPPAAELVPEDTSLKSCMDGCGMDSRNSKGTNYDQTEAMAEEGKDGENSYSEDACNLVVENNSLPIQNHDEKENCTVPSKYLNAVESCDGKKGNVAEGMDLYNELLDKQEVSKLVAVVNDLRAAGKKGQLQGETFVVSRRPVKGHGREMIQLGFAAADRPPEDGIAPGTTRERRVEPIPSFLDDLISRLVSKDIMTLKPDSCVIDIFNEGDYSQPHPWPHWFGRPIYILFLTECEMAFRMVNGADHPREYKSSPILSLAPGSLLAMHGQSIELAKRAIPSAQTQRIIITLTKFRPRTTHFGDSQHIHSPTSNRSPLPSRSPNYLRSKHYPSIPATGVLSSPPIHSQHIPPPLSPLPPMFTTAMPLAPGSIGWAAAAAVAPRNPSPHIPVPGTGVFLPPGSCNAPIPQPLSTVEVKENPPSTGIETCMGNGKDEHKSDVKMKQQDCSGNLSETGSETEEEHPQTE